MKISVQLEPQIGFDWPAWKRFIPALESMGFHTIYRSDHFPMGDPPETDALELITSLTYLALHTQRVNFGTLAAPLSFRDPVSLARQAMSLNDLSGGRMILGVGAGWNETEHRQYGYTLGDVKTRLDRLEEGLHVISALMREDAPVRFEGRFYKVQGAHLLPRPQQPPRLLVGGGGPKRTLPLAARFADIWNCHPDSPEAFARLNNKLNDDIQAAGREPEDVERSAMIGVLMYRSPEELEKHARAYQAVPVISAADGQKLVEMMQNMRGIHGSPQQVLDQMQAFAEAGLEEFVVQWFNPHDLDGLEQIASVVVPHFHTQPVGQ